jgi:hypothetical protein
MVEMIYEAQSSHHDLVLLAEISLKDLRVSLLMLASVYSISYINATILLRNFIWV